ncbi:DMT family transporter [Dongia sedimenti]|uniref:DMT family transporter n=1 Tax=Dongia sedimenti TaxID=3064282 RepID=A0ABU0YIT5_9PROT|nr:DMT family transporter [Rhodospirillaceae bacterium R-7]
MNRSPRVGVILALLCLLILGAMPVLSNARPAGSSGLGFAIWLSVWQLVAALPLFLFERGRNQRHRIGNVGRGTIAIALLTGAMFGLATYMYVVAAEMAGPVSMVIALQAYPLFAMLWEMLFLGRRKTRAELLFTLLMIAALVYLTTSGTFRIADISWWSAFALGIPLLWSIAHILLRRVLTTTPITPNQVTISRVAISIVLLLLLALGTGEGDALLALSVDPAFQWAAAIMGVAYYLELILWFYAMQSIDVSTGSSITVPAPAVTMAISVLVLGQGVAGYQVLAMLFIVLAMYGLLLAGKRRLAAESAAR